MKKCPTLLTLAGAALLFAAGCRLPPRQTPDLPSEIVHAGPDQKQAAALYGELGGDEGFFQIVQYLYRWYLDENDFERDDLSFRRQLWIRRVQTVTDESDNSRFMEIVLPAIGLTVNLKKTDYRINELKLDVRSDGYRVVRIGRDTRSAAEASDYVRFEFDPDALYARLFQARLHVAFPSDALLARLKEAVAREIAELDLPAARAGETTVDFAPIHAVANEQWAYWEEGKLLFRFTSDIDLGNLVVWAHDTLGVSIFDAVGQTVVSHEEKPGEARFITRDQVGRALYNCIVLGRKSSLPPPPVGP